MVIEAPVEVVLTFNRDIAAPASVAVTGPSGDRVGTADPAVQGPVVSVPVTARDQGTYTVGYRAVSVDGHPITGSFVFSVGHRSAAAGAGGQQSERSTSWVPLAVGLAALLAGLWSWRRRRRRSG